MTDESGQASRQQRFRALKQAFAGWSDLQSAVECTVRDMSDGGARIQFADTAVLPVRFELTIPIEGTITPCEVVWMKSGMVGVRFVGPTRQSKMRKRDQVLTAYRVDENRRGRQPKLPPPEDTIHPQAENVVPDHELYRPRPKKVAFGRRGY